jgi:hypothetical protein
MIKRGDKEEDIKKRLFNDDIQLRFETEVKQNEFIMNNIYQYYTVTELTNTLHFDILDLLYSDFKHRFELRNGNTLNNTMSNSIWDNSTFDEINESLIIFASETFIICKLYGDIRFKYESIYQKYNNEFNVLKTKYLLNN